MELIKVIQPSGETAIYVGNQCVEISSDENYISLKWANYKQEYPHFKSKSVYLNSEMSWPDVRKSVMKE